jgi:hypothetical protein
VRATPNDTGDFALTVTARNYLPVEQSVPCNSGSNLAFAGWYVNDSPGNNDHIANPGETMILPVWLTNTGTVTIPSPVEGVLRIPDPRVQVVDSTFRNARGLMPGETLYVEDAFGVTLASEPMDGEVLRFELEAGPDRQHLTWTSHPVLQVGEARLGLDRHWIVEPPLLPGQTKALRIQVKNSGHGIGHGTWARLKSLDGYVTVPHDSIGYGEVPPLGLGHSPDSFVVSVSSSCPPSYLALMQIEVSDDRCSKTDTFGLLVGETGFTDDVESGGARWSHGGSGDLWHISTYRAHSGGHSWYCGDDGTQRYSSNMNAWLATVPLVVAENCSLSFWRWFKVPNYGVDGIYVIVVRGSREDTLDFLGTGGALRDWHPVSAKETGACTAPLDIIESFWAQERYDLSFLGVGETIQVKLSFNSDRDTVDEGFYIDDVVVNGGEAPVVGVVEVKPRAERLPKLSLVPTPFKTALRVELAGVANSAASGRVLDASGRLMRGFVLLPARGRKAWTWDGRDQAGRSAPRGTYFVEVRAGARRWLDKALLMR